MLRLSAVWMKAAAKATYVEPNITTLFYDAQPIALPSSLTAEQQALVKKWSTYQLSFNMVPPGKPIIDPKQSVKKRKLLVLDLDETLGSGWPWIPRPHAEEFVDKALNLFNVVFWTRSPLQYAEVKVKKLCDTKRVKHPILAGWSSDYLCGGSSKELVRLGHRMDQVLLVDDDSDHLALQPRCVWKIVGWCGNASDTELKSGIEYLEAVAAAKTVQSVHDQYLATVPGANKVIEQAQRFVNEQQKKQ